VLIVDVLAASVNNVDTAGTFDTVDAVDTADTVDTLVSFDMLSIVDTVDTASIVRCSMLLVPFFFLNAAARSVVALHSC
jgi:hypothetical protein